MTEQAAVNPIFSILVCTVPSRIDTFYPRLMKELLRQAYGKPVEVLGLLDNKFRTVGAKRNALLHLAQGTHLAFVDDDDRVAANYVEAILHALDQNPTVDCVVFDAEVRVNGGPPKRCIYGIEYNYHETPELWTGKPAHTMVYRTALAKQAWFPRENFGEDTAWVKQVCNLVTTQDRIEEVLYFYDFSQETSETRTPKSA